MQQMGHASAALALEIYSKVMERNPDTGARMDALLRGAEWAPMGTNDETTTGEGAELLAPSVEENAGLAGFSFDGR